MTALARSACTLTAAALLVALPGLPALADPVAVSPSALTLTASATSVVYGHGVDLVGRLTEAGLPVVGVPVGVYGRTAGTTTDRLLRLVTSGPDGSVTTGLSPVRTTTYSLRFDGDAQSGPSTSPGATVALVPRLSAAAMPAAIVRGETSVLGGGTAPALAGVAVHVQRLVAGAWREVAAVPTGSTGRWSWPVAPLPGAYTYRAVLPAGTSWSRATSGPAVLRVGLRDLVSGVRGDDVLALQHALAVRHYDVGPVNGVFGYDLQHAVLAFQKVEALSRTGRWTAAERARLGAPHGWRVRFPGAGLAVEIDISQQVLVLSRGGVVQRIVDVSTGTDRLYTVDGITDRATTPRGRFAITHRIDGVRVSRLGTLYRPAYFVGGYAIHGSASVPAFPASHGCVRVTDPVMDRLFALLAVGTPVTVTD